MIKINLLHEKKARKVDKGQRALVIGAGTILAYAAGVYFLFHVPLAGTLDDQRAENDKKAKSNNELTQATREFDTVTAQLKSAEDQEAAIKRLNAARAVPSWMLYELSKILTKDHQPTMSPQMLERIKTDPNRQISKDWDPKRLWLTTLDETNGLLTITGGAQSTTDITQFALRLQASVFFDDITPTTTTTSLDPVSKLNFYNFTITGKALY